MSHPNHPLGGPATSATVGAGSTTATDDALAPLLTGKGVCRDYAHLVVTLRRALAGASRPAAFTVMATSDPDLPVEDVDALVALR